MIYRKGFQSNATRWSVGPLKIPECPGTRRLESDQPVAASSTRWWGARTFWLANFQILTFVISTFDSPSAANFIRFRHSVESLNNLIQIAEFRRELSADSNFEWAKASAQKIAKIIGHSFSSAESGIRRFSIFPRNAKIFRFRKKKKIRKKGKFVDWSFFHPMRKVSGSNVNLWDRQRVNVSRSWHRQWMAVCYVVAAIFVINDEMKATHFVESFDIVVWLI